MALKKSKKYNILLHAKTMFWFAKERNRTTKNCLSKINWRAMMKIQHISRVILILFSVLICAKQIHNDCSAITKFIIA